MIPRTTSARDRRRDAMSIGRQLPCTGCPAKRSDMVFAQLTRQQSLRSDREPLVRGMMIEAGLDTENKLPAGLWSVLSDLLD